MDANTGMEEKSEGNDEVGVVSTGKQDISIVNGGELVSSIEEEKDNHFEADGSKPEVKEGSDVEIEEVGSCFETEAELDEQKCDKTIDPKDQNMVMPLNASNEVQGSEGVFNLSLFVIIQAKHLFTVLCTYKCYMMQCLMMFALLRLKPQLRTQKN